MSDPERLRPGESRQALTERAAATFAVLAQSLRERGHEPQAVAHFVNRLVFCMFAEDVGLLPADMFTQMLQQARKQPEEFATMARTLFGAMATGGFVGFEAVAWFNGGCSTTMPPCHWKGLKSRRRARGGGARLVGDRPIDPGHAVRARSRPGQALAARGALHRPRQDHADRRAGGDSSLARGMGDGEDGDRRPPRTRGRCQVESGANAATRQAERRLRAFLERMRQFTVLDPPAARATSSIWPSMR